MSARSAMLRGDTRGANPARARATRTVGALYESYLKKQSEMQGTREHSRWPAQITENGWRRSQAKGPSLKG